MSQRKKKKARERSSLATKSPKQLSAMIALFVGILTILTHTFNLTDRVPPRITDYAFIESNYRENRHSYWNKIPLQNPNKPIMYCNSLSSITLPRLVSVFTDSDFLDKLRQDVPMQIFNPRVFL